MQIVNFVLAQVVKAFLFEFDVTAGCSTNCLMGKIKKKMSLMLEICVVPETDCTLWVCVIKLCACVSKDDGLSDLHIYDLKTLKMSRRDICAEFNHGFSQLMRRQSCADDCNGKR